ncbi:hypothetical protein [Tumebacillus permanentifrigoris]|uniref:Pre-peptidase n=1 Tax=Tumebacillus permanentifrigoris TaxID=378543 RepID=A0A316DCM4_9BACL|nr:hypothetical protein [Tumebacillus permanentifrigoris]PWK14253.1 hypothetical protein C7459_1056 [Tumebacillus permanentifrigoris]
MQKWSRTGKFLLSLLLAGMMMVSNTVQAADMKSDVKGVIPKNLSPQTFDFSKAPIKLSPQPGDTLKGMGMLDLEKAQPKLLSPGQTQLAQHTSSAANLVTPNAATNHDPNHAILLNLNTWYQDTLTTTGMQNWYAVYVPTPGKLTALMQTVNNASIDYDLHVYHLNQTTYTLENEIDSTYGPMTNEQLATVTQAPGYYYICVNSYQGFDATNLFYLNLILSSSYDTNEPNDNAMQANVKPGTFSLDGSIDNLNDVDWMSYTVTQDTKVNLYLSNSGAGTFKFDILNQSLQGLGTIPQNGSYYAILPKGSYYFRVRSENGTGSYHLDVNPQYVFDYTASVPSTPSNENINTVWSKIKAANPGVEFSTNVPLASIYKNSTVMNGVIQHYWYMEIRYTTSFYYDDIGYIIYNDQYKTFQLLDNGLWLAGYPASLRLSLGIFSDNENYKKYSWANPGDYHHFYLFDYYYKRDYTVEYIDISGTHPYFTSDKTSNDKRIIYGVANWFSDGSGNNELVRIDRATGQMIKVSNILFANNAEFENGTFESDNVYTFHSTKDGKTYRINLDTLSVLSAQ